MIKRRDYYHKSIKYSFNLNYKHFKAKFDNNTQNREEIKRLGSYFKQIYQGNIPNELFNEKNIARVSQFKVKGIKSTFLKSYSKKLIRSGKINVSNSNSKLSEFTRKVFENYSINQINKKPGHDPILKNILIKDQDSIAIEIPIWRNVNERFITGHIDLIQIKNNTIKVIDYKPEGGFLTSLPQVATYGLLFKNILKLNKLKCVSFNKDEAWEYDPLILFTDIKDYLLSHGLNTRIWESFIELD